MHTVFNIELDVDFVAQVRLSAVERAGLDSRLVAQDLQLRVQARSTITTEEVLVELTTVTRGIIRSRSS